MNLSSLFRVIIIRQIGLGVVKIKDVRVVQEAKWSLQIKPNQVMWTGLPFQTDQI